MSIYVCKIMIYERSHDILGGMELAPPERSNVRTLILMVLGMGVMYLHAESMISLPLLQQLCHR